MRGIPSSSGRLCWIIFGTRALHTRTTPSWAHTMVQGSCCKYTYPLNTDTNRSRIRTVVAYLVTQSTSHYSDRIRRRARCSCSDSMFQSNPNAKSPPLSSISQDTADWNAPVVKRAISTAAYGLGPDLARRIIFHLAHVL